MNLAVRYLRRVFDTLLGDREVRADFLANLAKDYHYSGRCITKSAEEFD